MVKKGMLQQTSDATRGHIGDIVQWLCWQGRGLGLALFDIIHVFLVNAVFINIKDREDLYHQRKQLAW